MGSMMITSSAQKNHRLLLIQKKLLLMQAVNLLKLEKLSLVSMMNSKEEQSESQNKLEMLCNQPIKMPMAGKLNLIPRSDGKIIQWAGDPLLMLTLIPRVG